VKLSVLERLIVLSILPAEGSFANLKLLRIAKENLSFTETENKELNFQQVDGQLKWMDGAVEDKDVEIGEVITQMIVKELEKMDDEEKLAADHITIYEKFI